MSSSGKGGESGIRINSTLIKKGIDPIIITCFFDIIEHVEIPFGVFVWSIDIEIYLGMSCD